MATRVTREDKTRATRDPKATRVANNKQAARADKTRATVIPETRKWTREEAVIRATAVATVSDGAQKKRLAGPGVFFASAGTLRPAVEVRELLQLATFFQCIQVRYNIPDLFIV